MGKVLWSNTLYFKFSTESCLSVFNTFSNAFKGADKTKKGKIKIRQAFGTTLHSPKRENGLFSHSGFLCYVYLVSVQNGLLFACFYAPLEKTLDLYLGHLKDP